MSAPAPASAATIKSPDPPASGILANPTKLRAQMTPDRYRRSAYFGQDHPTHRLRVIAGIVFLLFCAFFSIPKSGAIGPIQGIADFVALLASWGALPLFILLPALAMHYSRRALADIGVNHAIAVTVDASATARLQQIRQNPQARADVSQLESAHLPDNPSNPKPSALRLFQRICREAMDRRFESAINLIEPYQRESLEPILKLESVQRNALRWGILCHFIGLVIVIQAVPAILQRTQVAAVEPLPQTIAAPNGGTPSSSQAAGNSEAIAEILNGLRLAFGASVGGLAVSLFGAMLLAEVRTKQFAYFRKLDEATSTMLSLASNSLNNDELLVSLTHVSKRLEDQTLVVKEGIAVVAKGISDQASKIESGLKSLGDGKMRLDSFLQGISSSHEDFLKRLNTYYDVGTISTLVDGSEKRLSSTLKQSNAELEQRVSSTVQRSQKELETRSNAVAAALGEVKGGIVEIQRKISNPPAASPLNQPPSLFKGLRYLVIALAGCMILEVILLIARSI